MSARRLPIDVARVWMQAWKARLQSKIERLLKIEETDLHRLAAEFYRRTWGGERALLELKGALSNCGAAFRHASWHNNTPVALWSILRPESDHVAVDYIAVCNGTVYIGPWCMTLHDHALERLFQRTATKHYTGLHDPTTELLEAHRIALGLAESELTNKFLLPAGPGAFICAGILSAETGEEEAAYIRTLTWIAYDMFQPGQATAKAATSGPRLGDRLMWPLL